MKKYLLIALFVCLASGCQLPALQEEAVDSTAAQGQQSALSITDRSEVPRVTLAEAKQHFDQGTAYFVDARTRTTYEGRHIAGAFFLPATGLQEHLHELPKDKLVITYCT
ncbi:MAG: rhodanese-like domain-containing protein [Caldilineaceae bacterium]